MCIRLPEKSCILTMIYKKHYERNNPRYWDYSCSSQFARSDIILDIFNHQSLANPLHPSPAG